MKSEPEFCIRIVPGRILPETKYIYITFPINVLNRNYNFKWSMNWDEATTNGYDWFSYRHSLNGPAEVDVKMDGSTKEFYMLKGIAHRKEEWEKIVHSYSFNDKLQGIIE